MEKVRGAFDAWNRGDLEGLQEYLSPEWEWHPARLFPGTDVVYHGRAGMANVFTFRHGLVTRQVGYGDWKSALEAVGLRD